MSNGRVRIAVEQFKETVCLERDLEMSRLSLIGMIKRLDEEERVLYLRETKEWQEEFDARNRQ
jgi:hypothetical protein